MALMVLSRLAVLATWAALRAEQRPHERGVTSGLVRGRHKLKGRVGAQQELDRGKIAARISTVSPPSSGSVTLSCSERRGVLESGTSETVLPVDTAISVLENGLQQRCRSIDRSIHEPQ